MFLEINVLANTIANERIAFKKEPKATQHWNPKTFSVQHQKNILFAANCKPVFSS